jgi:hypothetical protein
VKERVLVTGDLNTMVGFAWRRVQAGLPMSGEGLHRLNGKQNEPGNRVIVMGRTAAVSKTDKI